MALHLYFLYRNNNQHFFFTYLSIFVLQLLSSLYSKRKGGWGQKGISQKLTNLRLIHRGKKCCGTSCGTKTIDIEDLASSLLLPRAAVTSQITQGCPKALRSLHWVGAVNMVHSLSSIPPGTAVYFPQRCDITAARRAVVLGRLGLVMYVLSVPRPAVNSSPSMVCALTFLFV